MVHICSFANVNNRKAVLSFNCEFVTTHHLSGYVNFAEWCTLIVLPTERTVKQFLALIANLLHHISGYVKS